MNPIGHILRTQDFSREFLEITLPEEVKKMEKILKKNPSSLMTILKRRKIALLFFEKSSYTMTVFRIAASNLGAQMILAEEGSKVNTGYAGKEDWAILPSSWGRSICIEDFVTGYTDIGFNCIVMRHSEEGLTARVAKAVDTLCERKIKVINAGEKQGQHPVWALRDLYTIQKDFGKIDGLSCVFMGDLYKNRVVNSLAYLLGKHDDVRINFVSSPSRKIDRNIINYLNRHNVFFEEFEPKNLPYIQKPADFFYIVKDHEDNYQKKTMPQIDTEFAHKFFHKKTKVYHPFPRGIEIPPWRADDKESQKITIDKTSYAGYFDQRANSMPLVMTLLVMALEPKTDVLKIDDNILF